MNTLSSLQAQGRANLFSKMKGETLTVTQAEYFIDTYALTVYNAALDAALQVLPEEKRLSLSQVTSNKGKEINDKAYGFNSALNKARAAITSLKKNV